MSFGMEVYRADGKKQFSTARLTRIVYKFNINVTASFIYNVNGGTTHAQYSQIRYYTLSVPGLRNDGKWMVLFTSIYDPSINGAYVILDQFSGLYSNDSIKIKANIATLMGSWWMQNMWTLLVTVINI